MIDVITLADLQRLQKRSNCGDELRRLVQEVAQASQLGGVHNVAELDSQARRQVVKEGEIVTHVH